MIHTNPLASLSHFIHGLILYHARRFDEAEASLKRSARTRGQRSSRLCDGAAGTVAPEC
jgi:hypothetical protein